MDGFAEIFNFQKCEELLLPVLYPYVKQIIEDFTRSTDGNWPRYDLGYVDRQMISDYQQRIQRIVELLNANDQKRETFLSNFPRWERQRKENIEKLQNIAEKLQVVRKGSNIAKITFGGVGIFGGVAIIGSLLFPPVAPALLPSWLGGATAAALLPSIFLGTAPAVTPLAIVGSVAAAGGAGGNVITSVTGQALFKKNLEEVKEVIEEDRRMLQELGVSEFANELNKAIDDLFGEGTSSEILNIFDHFHKKFRVTSGDIQAIRKFLQSCLKRILPRITEFLLVGISLSTIVLSIFFVVFMFRRQSCTILNHFSALDLIRSIDISVEVTRLVAAAGLESSTLGELIPRQLAGKVAVGAMAGVGIVLEIASVVVSAVDLAEGSLSDEILMISEIVRKLESQLSSYQSVKKELEIEGENE